MLLSWLLKQGLSWAMARLNAGDPRWVLLMDHPDVVLTFPGESSFSGVFRGKPQVAAWLRRFTELGIQIFADEVVAVGWPWRTTVCIRGRDHLADVDGTHVYANRYVIWAHLRWGRLRAYEVYEDTVAPVRFDAWMAEHRPEAARAV